MSSSTLVLASTLGWVGAIGTVAAYALVSQRVLSVTSRTFQATNAVSAALLTVSAMAHDSWPSAASNLVWVVIAVAALVRSRHLAAAPETGALVEAGPEPLADDATRRDEVPVGV